MKSLLSCGLALAVSVFLPSSLLAQTDIPPSNAPLAARINLGSGNVVKLTRTSFRFRRLSLDPNQIVGIALKYPAAMAGQTIVVEAPDGGVIRASDFTIDGNGVLTFAYGARDVVGNARLSLYDGNDTHFLQFWVRDLQHPERNP